MNFGQWIRRVDALMLRRYLITMADAGWSAPDLRRHFDDGVDPVTFVNWVGMKYALTDALEVGLRYGSIRELTT